MEGNFNYINLQKIKEISTKLHITHKFVWQVQPASWWKNLYDISPCNFYNPTIFLPITSWSYQRKLDHISAAYIYEQIERNSRKGWNGVCCLLWFSESIWQFPHRQLIELMKYYRIDNSMVKLPGPHDPYFLHYNMVAEGMMVQSRQCRFLLCCILNYLCGSVCLQRFTIVVAIFSHLFCSGARFQYQLFDL